MITVLIWRNIWRNKRRSFITMASVAFAVMLAVCMKSLQKGIFDNLIKNVVGFYSGYIQIHKTGYRDEQILDNSFDFREALIHALKKTENINSAVARIESFALVSSEAITRGCMVVGTQPEEENKLTGLKAKVIRGSYFEASDNAVLLAENLAGRLDISVYDTIVLLGQGYHGNSAAAKYPVKGIVHYGSPALNETLVFLPLNTAQQYFSADGKVTTVAININQPELLEIASDKIKHITGQQYEVLTWKEMMPEIDGHIKGDNLNFYIFIGVLYLLIAFGIFGTMLMMLAERKYELGMLLAIGMKKINLSMMLVGETILISVLGTIAGLALSFPLVKYFEVNPIKLGRQMQEVYQNFGFEAIWPTTLDLNIFLIQAVIVFCLSIIIGMFPIFKVMNMEAVNSMKR